MGYGRLVDSVTGRTAGMLTSDHERLSSDDETDVVEQAMSDESLDDQSDPNSGA